MGDSISAKQKPLHHRANLMKVYAQQGDTVDAICWRYYGRTQGIVEQVLQKNTGLADAAILPHGTAVELPEQASAAVAQTVQLWD